MKPKSQEDTPRFQRNFFLRSIGFELPCLLSFGRGPEEVPKPVVQNSRSIAFYRCGVHILPVVVSIAIININLCHIYLGRGLPGSIMDVSVNMALLQVAAKIQELLILSSVTVVVIEVIRYEMLFGEGVALGAISGGFTFTSLQYFWSPEFWGSLRAKSAAWPKFRLCGILILGGVLATFAGPSCAVLLIPRDQPWDAGSASIYLRGTPDELWPSQMEFSETGFESFCTAANATDYDICPSGGYLSIRNARENVHIYGTQSYAAGLRQNLTTNILFSGKPVVLPSNFQRLPTLQVFGNHRGYACETSARGTNAIEAMFQLQLLNDWVSEAFSIPYSPFVRGPTASEYKYFEALSASTSTKIPAVRVACSHAQNVSARDNAVHFPIMPEDGCSNSMKLLKVSELNRTASNRIRTTWALLPPEYGTVSAGLIFEAPWVATGNWRAVVGCSIDARWANGTIETGSITARVGASGDSPEFKSYIGTSRIRNTVSTLRGSPAYSEFRPVLKSSSSRPIKLSQSWLRILTPPISWNDPRSGQSNLNTLESMLISRMFPGNLSGQAETWVDIWNEEVPNTVNRTVSLEWLLAVLVTDGLSREGSARVLNITGAPSSWGILDYNKKPNFQNKLFQGQNPLERPKFPDVVEESIKITIGGYSYQAGSTTDYLSIAVLLLHIILALGHTTYLIWMGQSSGCWDTFLEFMVLMQNSRPAPIALRNANAGIRELTTYSKVAVIRAIKGQNGDENEFSNVEVLFREDIFTMGDSWEEPPSSNKAATWPLISTRVRKTGVEFHSTDQDGCGEADVVIVERVQPDKFYGHPQNRIPARTSCHTVRTLKMNKRA